MSEDLEECKEPIVQYLENNLKCKIYTNILRGRILVLSLDDNGGEIL